MVQTIDISPNPKVSIVVPVYNVEKYLDRCVQSLRNQTLNDIEIILVDDGSPDNCPKLCDEYARYDTRIRVVHKQNAGLGMACNSGLEIATGEYIAFCDSDDWVEREMYNTLYHTATEENAQMVFSGINRVTENGDSSIMSIPDEYLVTSNTHDINKIALDMIASAPDIRKERRIAMSAKTVLYKRTFLNDNNILFESERTFISEDLIFNIDCLSNASTVVEYPKAFYNYFINTNSLTGTIRNDRFDKYLILRSELLKRYSFDANELRTRINRMFIGYVRDEITRICRNKQHSIKDKKNILKRISENCIWEELYRDYPVSKMPMNHKLYFYALRYKLIYLLIVGAYLK